MVLIRNLPCVHMLMSFRRNSWCGRCCHSLTIFIYFKSNDTKSCGDSTDCLPVVLILNWSCWCRLLLSFVHDIQSRTIINLIVLLYLPLTNVDHLIYFYIVDQYLSNYWPSSNVLLLKNCLPMVLILKQIMLVLYVAVDQWLRLTLTNILWP